MTRVTVPTAVMPSPAPAAVQTRHAHVIQHSRTWPAEVDCEDGCGRLERPGLYLDADILGRQHVQATGHVVTVTSLRVATYRMGGRPC